MRGKKTFDTADAARAHIRKLYLDLRDDEQSMTISLIWNRETKWTASYVAKDQSVVNAHIDLPRDVHPYLILHVMTNRMFQWDVGAALRRIDDAGLEHARVSDVVRVALCVWYEDDDIEVAPDSDAGALVAFLEKFSVVPFHQKMDFLMTLPQASEKAALQRFTRRLLPLQTGLFKSQLGKLCKHDRLDMFDHIASLAEQGFPQSNSDALSLFATCDGSYFYGEDENEPTSPSNDG